MPLFIRDVSVLRRFWMYSMFIIAAGFIHLQDCMADGEIPDIKIVGGSRCFFGEVGPTKLEREVKIVNLGRDTLRILEISSSCGCTLAPIDREEIPMGDTATLSVSIDLRKKDGPTEQYVNIKTNRDSTKAVKLDFVALVVRDLTVSPRNFPTKLNLMPGAEATSSIMIHNTGQDTIYLQQPVAAIEGLTVEFATFDGNPLLPGGTATIQAKLVGLSAGFKAGIVSIASSSKFVPTLSSMLAAGITDSEENSRPDGKQGMLRPE